RRRRRSPSRTPRSAPAVRRPPCRAPARDGRAGPAARPATGWRRSASSSRPSRPAARSTAGGSSGGAAPPATRCSTRCGADRPRHRRGAIDILRVLEEHVGDDAHLLLGLLPVPLLERLAHAGQRLHAIAGVEAGRIDLVHEPWPARQPLLTGERALAL